jgi:hypothetical protein
VIQIKYSKHPFAHGYCLTMSLMDLRVSAINLSVQICKLMPAAIL